VSAALRLGAELPACSDSEAARRFQ
jgi:hypothetical protein